MCDLIRRRDAVSRMSDLLMMELQGQRLPTWNEVYQAMNDVPSVKSERKEGKWISGDGKDTFIHCSVCYEEAYWDSDYGQQTFDFCPYCGADMRGEDGKA